MMIRTSHTLLLAANLLASTAFPVFAGEAQGQFVAGQFEANQSVADRFPADQIAAPVLRATVNVTGDIVRVGDLIDNAGAAAQVAVYRAPDLGTTGLLPTAQVIAALRSHQVIGVDTRNIKEVAVTRLARSIDAKEVELAVAKALEHRSGLGEAANIAVSFDQPVQELKLDAADTGALNPRAVRIDPRNGRFDVSFDLGNGGTTAKLRFTGTAIETVEVVVLTRNIDRTDVLRTADLAVERRPKAELAGGEPISRVAAVGMQTRRPLRAGQALKTLDLTKPDLVVRDQDVTLIYQTAGVYLTTRGKALESGSDGDTVNVLNVQSKRTVSGHITGRGQVSVDIVTPRPAQTAEARIEAPVTVASRLPTSATPKAE
jgi:flagella basal body P-ring formation protein FlgA